MTPYFTMLQWTIFKFPVRKERFLSPGAEHGRKMDAAGPLGPQDFKENTTWQGKIHASLIRVFQLQ